MSSRKPITAAQQGHNGSSPLTPRERDAVRGGWPERMAAIACFAISLAGAAIGLRLLFAGKWLESHDVKYGPIAIIVFAVLAGLAAIVLALVGAVRRPRTVSSWVVVAVVLLGAPAALVLARALGF
jgi:hypothetical protein